MYTIQANATTEERADFNEQINQVNGIMAACLIVINCIPGLIIDYLSKICKNSLKGRTIGILGCFSIRFHNPNFNLGH